MKLQYLIARPAILIGSLLCVVAMTPPAPAQSDSDLRKQNQQLSARIQELEKQLKDALDQNKALEERIKQLQQQITALKSGSRTATATPTPAATPEKVTIDESQPNASPRALLNGLVADYANTLGPIDMGQPGDGKRNNYVKKLEGWKSAVNREFRTPITWHVEIIGSTYDSHGNRVVKLIAVDPKSYVQLGQPFEVTLPKLIEERVALAESRGEAGLFVLRGILAPAVRVNIARETRGSFDNPPFIGPFAELQFTVEPRSMLPAKDDEKDQPKAASKPADSKSSSAPPAPPAAKPAKPVTTSPPEKP